MTTEPLWIGIDLGTQSVRAIVADANGSVIASAASILTSSKRAGREHIQDPEEWWRAVCTCCRKVMEGVRAEDVLGMAIDGTSGTILFTDDKLRPASEALMYDDGRAEKEAQEVEVAGGDLWAEFSYRMQPSWALPKLLWLWRNRGAYTKSPVRLTHQNDFIQNRLAGRWIATDWSNSLKTGYDLVRQQWPQKVLEKLSLPETLFPDVVAPGRLIGEVSTAAARETGLPAGLAICSGMTDGCAAQIAATGAQPGTWNSVLGTTLVIKGVTEQRLRDPSGVLYSHRAPDGHWLPGGASSSGAGILAKRFQKEDLDRLERLASERGPTAIVTYPLTGRGERFPFVEAEAQSFETGEARDDVDRYRSILQGVAFVERLSFDSVKMLGAPAFSTVAISGGAVRSALWNQIRADVLEKPLTIGAVTESAFGMAVVAASRDSSLREAARRMLNPSVTVTVSPAASFAETYGELYGQFLGELEQRGWLPRKLAAYSREQINQ